MRKREPPESHKQCLYKLPQVSWSWEVTLIVHWGDFSSEGYYLHIRNLYTFKNSWWISAFCCCLLWAIFARNLLSQWTTCGCESSMLVVCQVTICLQLEELATIHFGWLKIVDVAVSNWTRAVPFFFYPIGEILFFPMCWCVCGSRCLSVKNTSTSVHKCWSIHILKYVKVRQHIIFEVLLKRGRARINLGVLSRRVMP